MLHRLSKSGLVCITQPHHAWLSGQLAQAWGNEQFGNFVPKEEVCLAAQLHDIGWLQWEQQPTLNPETGYPDKFTQLPTQVHIDIWSNVKHLSLCFGRYVTLLISLHGTGLYERFTSWKNSSESTQLVQSFLKDEYAFQKEIIELLKKDKYYSLYTSPLQIERNRQLIAAWDTMSIILCTGKKGEEYISQVPTINGTTTLTLTLTQEQDDHQTIVVAPWAFKQREINLVYEGRLLQQTFIDEAAMREALRGDCWVTLNTTLIPE